MKKRYSLLKEDRIAQLYSQGYNIDIIARIVNGTPGGCRFALRRRRRRWMHPEGVRRGRYANFLSDAQIDDIRSSYAAGETQESIAQRYELHQPAISYIVNNKSYKESEDAGGYAFDFSNRLVSR